MGGKGERRLTIDFAYSAIFEIMHVLGKYDYKFTDEKSETQSGQMTFPRSHSKFMTKTIPDHGSADTPFSISSPAP